MWGVDGCYSFDGRDSDDEPFFHVLRYLILNHCKDMEHDVQGLPCNHGDKEPLSKEMMLLNCGNGRIDEWTNETKTGRMDEWTNGFIFLLDSFHSLLSFSSSSAPIHFYIT